VAAENYSPVQLKVTNARGIPDVLLNASTFDRDPQFNRANIITNATTREEIRYVIERLCTKTGAADPQFCITADQGLPPGSDSRAILDLAPQVLFRITVRVDGPRNTASFTQSTFVP
jgi:hypothetical protein